MSNPLNRAKAALKQAEQQLLEALLPEGCWRGELSDSALATAVAVCALERGGRTVLAARGKKWLRDHRNEDGGWGDSPESPSHFTATLLCRAVLGEVTESSEELTKRILAFYGADRTFSVPILTMCRLTGALDDWEAVPQLPFELAALPHRFYRFVRLPVVSYALPALIAIGLVRHRAKPSRVGWLRWLRDRLSSGVLKKLEKMQPASGGFLEAAPLTGFVAMSLIAAGEQSHRVTQGCLRFLEETVRAEGCWSIDVDLSMWVTSLSVRALGDSLPEAERERIRSFLLSHQWKRIHPFTQSNPGGWAWTDRSGGVPDADDTSAALLALWALGPEEVPVEAVEQGIDWLLALQNRDGGLPTFCRGWGRLPFDRSCPDITAHAVQAWARWRAAVSPALQRRMVRAEGRALVYLRRSQRSDGSWVPLWFGSQGSPREENPLYGTACVLKGFADEKGRQFLRSAEPVGVEELALRLGATGLGLDALLEQTGEGRFFPARPIGLYFASLWYSEKMYPLIFTVEALRRYILSLEDSDAEDD
jgi:squalene-hopene/tetraprenyl-beta-curcumene cyclase